MAGSSIRPLVFDVRRIESKPLNDSSSSAHASSSGTSADAYVRRQAMIEAAENRQNANRSKYTLKKPSSSTEAYGKDRSNVESNEDVSEETRKAIGMAKELENQRVNELGFNVYESAKISGDQGRSVKTSMDASTTTAAPLQDTNEPSSINRFHTSLATIDPSFDAAWAVFLSNPDTSSHEKKQSVSIICKVTMNALTKGQLEDEATASKFRRIRLSNPKIMQHITNIVGAVDILMSFGFVLCEEDGQDGTSLLFPPRDEGPTWIDEALTLLERYENE